jgi:hypothetical protein
MTSQQYEELCRLAIADRLKVDVAQIRSVYVANKRRKAPWYEFEMRYRHQIDLYWETETDFARYITIANAKWRARNRVRQQDVLLLEMVRRKVGAHKAMIITNSGFTGTARVVAMDEGIGLLIVRPNFNSRSLHPTRRGLILSKIQELAKTHPPGYTYEVEVKGHEPVLPASQTLPQPPETFHSSAAGPVSESTLLPAFGVSPPVSPLLGSAGGSQAGPSPAPASGFSGYSTRLGPGPGFRMK